MSHPLLSRFGALTKTGEGWTGLCPAHPDKARSLSLRVSNGKLLLNCFAGCTYESILAAKGLMPADVHVNEPVAVKTPQLPVTVGNLAHAKGLPVAALTRYKVIDVDDLNPADKLKHGLGGRDGIWIPYFHADGTIAARTRHRSALIAKDGSFWLTGQGSGPVLPYGLHDLQDAREQGCVVLCEGESDYWTLRHAGIPALGLPGAQMVRALRPEHLTGIPAVYVAQDNDTAGEAFTAGVKQHVASWGLAGVFPVLLPATCKDVNDLYRKDHVAFHDAFVTLMQTAATGQPPVTVPALVRMSSVTREEIRWIWPKRIARGKYTLLAGDPGQGKSRVTFDIAAKITRGGGWPDGGRAPQGDVVFLCGEDGLSDTVRPALEQVGADLDRVWVIPGVPTPEGTARHFSLATDVPWLEAQLAAVQAVLLVIDPITAYLGKADSYKDAEVRGLLSPLLAAMERLGCGLLAVAHLAKDAQKAAIYRPGGSIAFVAAARILLIMGCDPLDEERRAISSEKQNICQKAETLAFRLPDGHVQWEFGPCSLDASAMLQRPDGRTARAEHTDAHAQEIVRSLLADGNEVPSEALKTHAMAQGVSFRQLKEAKKALGVRARKDGFSDATWYVQLLPETREGAHHPNK